MQIIEKAKLYNEIDIQIEDWSKDYSCFSYANTLAAYPKSKNSCRGAFSPKVGERFRAEFEFDNAEECKQAFIDLQSGKTMLKDYVEKMRLPVCSKEERQEYYKCL